MYTDFPPPPPPPRRKEKEIRWRDRWKKREYNADGLIVVAVLRGGTCGGTRLVLARRAKMEILAAGWLWLAPPFILGVATSCLSYILPFK